MQKTQDRTYGYIWSDWLYRGDKDSFMIEVYDECKEIDQCANHGERSERLTALRDRVQGSRKPWVEGILDFIDFETARLGDGKSPLDDLWRMSEDSQVLEIVQGAFLHGAFRGLCRKASGEEWIGQLGELMAAALHQGLKWMRTDGVADWELPTMGEHWCRGTAMWALCSMIMTVDAAGDNPDNDEAIYRMHEVISAHHMAGTGWLKYRGAHPHKWFSPDIRGTAPESEAIRRFGQRYNYPAEMIDILCRASVHVNSWRNPPAPHPVHFDRCRGLLIGSHTPRLNARVNEICEEMISFSGGVTDSEAAEIGWRTRAWFSTLSSRWRGRGDVNDRVIEICAVGSITGPLRESRPHLTMDFVDGLTEWARRRCGHLPEQDQSELMSIFRQTVMIRGRVPEVAPGYTGSAGVGNMRFIDGVWILSIRCIILGSPPGEYDSRWSDRTRELRIRFFTAVSGSKRTVGVDMPAGDDNSGCPVCLGDRVFVELVDNQMTTPVLQCSTWGSLLYANSGLGLPDDNAIGSLSNQGVAVDIH